MTISETIAYLQQFSKSGKPVKDLSRMQSLLEELGNPQEQLRFVHIAGTNGKGSVVAYGSAAAIAAGIQTGQFTLSGTIKTGFRSMEQIFQTTVFVHAANR